MVAISTTDTSETAPARKGLAKRLLGVTLVAIYDFHGQTEAMATGARVGLAIVTVTAGGEFRSATISIE